MFSLRRPSVLRAACAHCDFSLANSHTAAPHDRGRDDRCVRSPSLSGRAAHGRRTPHARTHLHYPLRGRGRADATATRRTTRAPCSTWQTVDETVVCALWQILSIHRAIVETYFNYLRRFSILLFIRPRVHNRGTVLYRPHRAPIERERAEGTGVNFLRDFSRRFRVECI